MIISLKMSPFYSAARVGYSIGYCRSLRQSPITIRRGDIKLLAKARCRNLHSRKRGTVICDNKLSRLRRTMNSDRH